MRFVHAYVTALLVALVLALTLSAQSDAQLTETELLRLQVVALQQQVASVNGALESCRIELAHPGYRFDPAKGLVKKDAPSP